MENADFASLFIPQICESKDNEGRSRECKQGKSLSRIKWFKLNYHHNDGIQKQDEDPFGS